MRQRFSNFLATAISDLRGVGAGGEEDVDNSLVPLVHRGGYLNIILNRKVNKHARNIIYEGDYLG